MNGPRAAAAVIVAAAALAAGCGGAKNEPDLAAALQRTEATGSARMTLRGVEESGANQTEIACDGVADYARRRSRLSCMFEGFRLEVLSVGGTEYTRLRGEALPFAGPDADKWTTEEDNDPLHESLSPEKLLTMLRDAAIATERVGADDVRGERTTEYRLTVDPAKAKLETSADSAEVDVWLGQDGLVRRVEAESNGRFTIEFFDFGVDVLIEAPPRDEIRTREPAPPPVSLPACGGLVSKPIGIEKAAATLRRHGFSVETSCPPGAPAAAVLSNASSARSPSIIAREGRLSCFVLERPSSSTVVVPTQGSDAELELRNLRCSIAVDGPRSDERVRRLRDALNELERTIRP